MTQDISLSKRQAESVASHIEAAADLIDTKGWCTGAFSRGERHCALGALGDVPGAGRTLSSIEVWGSSPDKAMLASWALEGQTQADYGTFVADFNDAQRDKRKVTRMMRRAARNLRKSRTIKW